MKVKINCLNCKIKFEYNYYKRIRKFCSNKCSENYHNFWDKASLLEKINRLKFYFEKYVEKKEGCWGWNGTSLLSKRGRLSYKKKQIQAHRASWLIHKGEIPDNMYVCHICDNEICTNPDHLFLGTPSENTIDMVLKDRKKNSKLKVKDVYEIWELIKQGIPGIKIAKQFKVHPMTISDIKIRRSWKHLNLP